MSEDQFRFGVVVAMVIEIAWVLLLLAIAALVLKYLL